MSWKHTLIENEEGEFEVVEMHFTPAGRPFAYSKPFLIGETVQSLRKTLFDVLTATAQPPVDVKTLDLASAPWEGGDEGEH